MGFLYPPVFCNDVVKVITLVLECSVSRIALGPCATEKWPSVHDGERLQGFTPRPMWWQAPGHRHQPVYITSHLQDITN